MDQGFPELLKSARQEAGYTTRRLKDELKERGVQASITYINFVEKERVKPGYAFSGAVGQLTGIGAEQALRAAFLYRVKWAVDRERDHLRILAEEKGLSAAAVKRITALDIPNC
jgi:hypothetical protein